jgi:hypothetical protein
MSKDETRKKTNYTKKSKTNKSEKKTLIREL